MSFELPTSEFEGRYRKEKNARAKTRLHILLLRRQKYSQLEIAAMVRVTQGTVSNVCQRFKKEGWLSVYDKQRDGRPSRLTHKQQIELKRRMSEEFVDEKTRRGWQTKDVRMLLKEEFKTRYTPQHTRRLLHKIGMSWKVPRPEHKNRDPVAIETFKKTLRGRSCLWQMNTKSSA